MSVQRSVIICGVTDSLISQRTEVTTSQKTRPVSVDQRNQLKDLLKGCQGNMRQEVLESNPHFFYSNVDNVTCFTNQLIDDTILKCDSLFSVDDILEMLPVWNVDHAHKIYSCLYNVFADLMNKSEACFPASVFQGGLFKTLVVSWIDTFTMFSRWLITV
ncbi:hypothetical protein OS493_004945 [Desmophyllum pertusum]|uniref:Uncharacterized protein n=1 Tax=Desmophyllum pertusum TaxID=174260 RepID=A0A9X0CSP2_9CNID|nr:hypothetical protein OS493_004945 [Desmophyllum pertusum]